MVDWIFNFVICKLRTQSFSIVAMEFVPKCVIYYLKMILFNEKELKTLIHKLQIKLIAETVKTCNSFQNFGNPLLKL